MNSNSMVIDDLKQYLAKGLFSAKSYHQLVIIPNDGEIRMSIKSILGVCIDEIINILQKDVDKKRIKTIMKKSLSRFTKIPYDTEDREFICECFNHIACMVEVDFKNELNTWLYGKIFGFLLRFKD